MSRLLSTFLPAILIGALMLIVGLSPSSSASNPTGSSVEIAFDTGWQPVTATAGPLDPMAQLGQLNLKRNAIVEIHVGYRGKALIENLTPNAYHSTAEHPAYSYAQGSYFWIGDPQNSGSVMLAPCTTLYGPDMAATNGVPDQAPTSWDGECFLDCGDMHLWPVEIPDAFAPITIALAPGRYPIRAAAYGLLTSVDGQPTPTYQGHGPCRLNQMDCEVRIWATVTNH